MIRIQLWAPSCNVKPISWFQLLENFLGGILSYLTFFIEKALHSVYISYKGNSLSGQVVPLARPFNFWWLEVPSQAPQIRIAIWTVGAAINPMDENEFASIQVQAMALAFACASRVLAAIVLTGPFMTYCTLFFFMVLKTLHMKWTSLCDSWQGFLTHYPHISSSRRESYTVLGRVFCTQVRKQFPSYSHICMTYSLFLVFDPLGTCPTVSHVTREDHGEAHVALIKSTVCSYINPLPAVSMWLIWPSLPLASLYASAALFTVDTWEYF